MCYCAVIAVTEMFVNYRMPIMEYFSVAFCGICWIGLRSLINIS